MSRLRLVLVLFLAGMLDFAAPAVPEALEVIEECEHVAQSGRMRRSMRLARDARTPATVRDTHGARVQRPARVGITASRRTVTIVPARKIPPVLAESSSAPEDH